MGIVIHHYVSPYSFVMGILWFNAFVLLGLVMRRLRFPIKFSVIPLLLLIVLSVLRMFIFVDIPGAAVIFSETLYPSVVNFVRLEIVSFITVAHLFIFVWVAVAVVLTVRYIHDYAVRYHPLMNLLGSFGRDEYAKSLLASEVGLNKHLRIFRNKCISSAVSTPYRPYIILPDLEFTDDELRVILRHEWKHIRDKDYLTGIIINLICFVFWWNPIVYLLKNHFSLAKELKCDQFAITNNEGLCHFLEGLQLMDKEDTRKRKVLKFHGLNAITGEAYIFEERLEALVAQSESRITRVFAGVFYSIIICVLFFVSYMVTVLPAFWESPDVPISAEDFTGEYSEYGDILRAEETFLVDNSDGTFSLYINGLFAGYVDEFDDILNWLPIRIREDK